LFRKCIRQSSHRNAHGLTTNAFRQTDDLSIVIYKNECLFGSVCGLYAFLNSWTDFDDIFSVCLNGSQDNLDSQLDPVGQPEDWGGAQTGILRVTMVTIGHKINI